MGMPRRRAALLVVSLAGAMACGSELAAPFKKIIAADPPEKREEAVAEEIARIRQFSDGKSVNLPATNNSTTARVL